MLIEIIIYIALFATLFSGAFAAAFQGIDAMAVLEHKKETLEAESFLAARLDSWLQSSDGWLVLTENNQNKLQFNVSNSAVNDDFKNNPYILFLDNDVLKIKCANCADGFKQTLSAENLQVDSLLPQIIETATSSIKILNISLNINQTNYVFSYYAQK